MVHRGRLNVLCNIVGKTYEQIFSEFEGVAPDDLSSGTGDVKYHLGYMSQYETMDKKSICKPNAQSIALKAVNPVVQRVLPR